MQCKIQNVLATKIPRLKKLYYQDKTQKIIKQSTFMFEVRERQCEGMRCGEGAIRCNSLLTNRGSSGLWSVFSQPPIEMEFLPASLLCQSLSLDTWQCGIDICIEH
jgi:hypothetical protein